MNAAASSPVPYERVSPIVLGLPSHRGDDVVIPFTASVAKGDSAQELSKVAVSVEASSMYVTLYQKLVADDPPIPTEILVHRQTTGTFSVAYKDPDGTTHPLGSVTIPAE